MSKLAQNNLQEFCRTCLSSLRPRNTKSVKEIGTPLEYNIFSVPNLAKLMILFTSLEVDNDKNAVYPKSLCPPCYYKLLDFQEFRRLALQSAEELYRIVNDVDNIAANTKTIGSSRYLNAVEDAKSTPTINRDTFEEHRASQKINGTSHEEIKTTQESTNTKEKEYSSDTHLQIEKNIKIEPIDIDESRVQTPSPPTQFCQQYEQVNIKNEIDSEFDEDEDEEDIAFYERNALASSITYDSIGDDADDEEHALRNGAANTSSSSLQLLSSNSPTSTNTVSRQRSSKRDRNKKSLKCPRCDKQVYKQVYLDAHIRGVHEGHEKPFLCIECHKAFTRYNQLHVHMQSNHLLAQQFTCEFDGCDASFKLSNTLETHRKVVHTENETPYPLELQKVLELHRKQLSREIEMDNFCHQCSKKYSSKRALTEHLKRHAQVKEHVCKVCGVAKVTRTELQTHMRTHDPDLKKFKCTICPQEFNHKNAISRHVRVVHEGQRRFVCSVCHKRFGTRNSQICHERLHTGEKPFNCELCNKGFAQLEGLKSHMKNHDKTLRKHVCSFCAKRFITKKNLLDHEERHRGDKPHICSTCSRGFCIPQDLEKHYKQHEEEREEQNKTVGDMGDEDEEDSSQSSA